MAELVVTYEGREVARHRLDGSAVTVGRLRACSLVLKDPKASRNHARLTRDGQRWRIEDLASAGGTLVNGQRVESWTLSSGDRVGIGDHTLVYVQPPEQQPTRSDPGELHASRRSRGRDGHGLVRPKDAPSTEETRDDGHWTRMQTLLASIDGLPPAATGGTRPSVQAAVSPSAEQSREARRLQALFTIGRVVREGDDFTTVLEDVLDRAIGAVGAERGLVFLRDDRGELEPRVARADGGRSLSHAEAQTASRTWIDRALHAGCAVRVQDALAPEWVSDSVMAHSLGSGLVAPLTVPGREEPLGVLVVDARVPDAFDDEDLAFFGVFALQAATAIQAGHAYWSLVDRLFEASEDLVLVVTPAGRIRQANRAADEALGDGASPVVGRAWPSLMRPADRAVGDRWLTEALQSGVAPTREFGLLGRDGEALPTSLAGFALHDRDGAPSALCVLGRDLRAQKALQAQLERQAEAIRRTFGRYLSDEVVTQLLDEPEGTSLGGDLRTVTVLMADLRGFSPIAERLDPREVVRLLNIHHGAMVDVVAAHRGTVDELLGDGMLALFGAPTERPDDAARAVRCALAMQEAVAGVNARLEAEGLPAIGMGVGLATGEVVAGNIGSETRTKYGVVGAAVNLASRLEGLTGPGQVLACTRTVQGARGAPRSGGSSSLAVGEGFDAELKGFAGTVRVWPIGRRAGDVPQAATRRKVSPPRPIQLAPRESRLAGRAESTPALLFATSATTWWVAVRSGVEPPPVGAAVCARDPSGGVSDVEARVATAEPVVKACGGMMLTLRLRSPNPLKTKA